jgi:hypothetical protein
MANVNSPFGFQPTMRTNSGASGRCISAHKLVGFATALFMNDAVTHAAAGTKPTPCIDSNITPGTTPVLGVNLNYAAASVASDHTIVLAGGGALFIVQGDGTGATFLVAASLSKNANMAILAGTAALKRSKSSLSETSLNTTNTLDLHVRKLFESPDNVLGQYARVEVNFNNLVDGDQKVGI